MCQKCRGQEVKGYGGVFKVKLLPYDLPDLIFYSDDVYQKGSVEIRYCPWCGRDLNREIEG